MFKECPKCKVRCQWGYKAVSGHQSVYVSWFRGYSCILCQIEFV